MTKMNILSVDVGPYQDTKVVSKQLHTYTPFTTAFGNDDEIRIAIQSQDLYILPSESYLVLEIEAAARAGAPEGAEAHYIFNFLPFLFSEVRYELNGVEIERSKNPGISSTMKRLLASPLSNKELEDLTTFYQTKKIEAGKLSFVLPLNQLLGFAEDYNKVIMNAKHELILIRSRTNDNAYEAEHDCISLKVTKIQWKMPHIALSDHARLKMLKYLERQREIKVSYRSWELYEVPAMPMTSRHIWSVKTTTQANRPRYVVVGLQTNRNNVRARDASSFDHCDISDVKLYLNSACYPYDNLNLNFEEDNYQELAMAFYRIQKSYYNGAESYNPIGTNYRVFKSRCLFAFDCSRSEESLMNSAIDVRVEIMARRNIPANTSVYCLIISDNMIEYSPFNGVVNRMV